MSVQTNVQEDSEERACDIFEEKIFNDKYCNIIRILVSRIDKFSTGRAKCRCPLKDKDIS